MIEIKGTAEELALLFERVFLAAQGSGEQRAPTAVPVAYPPPAEPAALPAAPADRTPGKAYIRGETQPTTAESFWGSSVPGSGPADPVPKAYQDKMLRERVESGGVAFYHLVTTWAQNFNRKGKQPDRARAVAETMQEHGRDVFFFLRDVGGLTKAVRSVSPNLGKAESRLIAENMASVSSALGVGLSDYLEYDQETRSIKP